MLTDVRKKPKILLLFFCFIISLLLTSCTSQSTYSTEENKEVPETSEEDSFLPGETETTEEDRFLPEDTETTEEEAPYVFVPCEVDEQTLYAEDDLIVICTGIEFQSDAAYLNLHMENLSTEVISVDAEVTAVNGLPMKSVVGLNGILDLNAGESNDFPLYVDLPLIKQLGFTEIATLAIGLFKNHNAVPVVATLNTSCAKDFDLLNVHISDDYLFYESEEKNIKIYHLNSLLSNYEWYAVSDEFGQELVLHHSQIGDYWYIENHSEYMLELSALPERDIYSYSYSVSCRNGYSGVFYGAFTCNAADTAETYYSDISEVPDFQMNYYVNLRPIEYIDLPTTEKEWLEFWDAKQARGDNREFCVDEQVTVGYYLGDNLEEKLIDTSVPYNCDRYYCTLHEQDADEVIDVFNRLNMYH